VSAPAARDSRLPLVVTGYLTLTIVVTWPLALGLGRDVPGDLGDSLLNMWILAWGAEHVPRLLTGATSWQGFWNAGIFHPEPYSLALSEHLFAQVLQVAPVYALTGNIILGYNLIFLSTFVLSAIGMYLLVRDLTGDWRAAAIAGLAFGFLPHRIAQVPHLQVLSAQWMPLTLWGFHRYIAHRSARALVGGTAALALQNLSCGYYLLYFAPFVTLFVVQQLWVARRMNDARAWLALLAAGGIAAVVTVPFLLPYLEVQRLYGFGVPSMRCARSRQTSGHATAAEPLRLGTPPQGCTRARGETFLGVTVLPLATIAVGAAALDACGGVRNHRRCRLHAGRSPPCWPSQWPCRRRYCSAHSWSAASGSPGRDCPCVPRGRFARSCRPRRSGWRGWPCRRAPAPLPDAPSRHRPSSSPASPCSPSGCRSARRRWPGHRVFRDWDCTACCTITCPASPG
jgi:hypothetical protein